MAIEQRILQAELKFFENELRDARFLILNTDSYAELFDGSFEDNVYYEGLIVAVTHNDEVLDFELA